MYNPYKLYSVTFLIAILFYSLRWSNLFVGLSAPTLLFLLVSGVIMMFVGKVSKSDDILKWNKIESDKYTYIFTALALVGHSINFLYARKITLINIILSKPNEVTEGFNGIPFIHVLLVSFTTFYCTYLFHIYVSTKKRKDLYMLLANFIPLILLFNRSSIVIVIMNCIWILMMKIRHVSAKFLIGLTFFTLVMGYIFGIAGDKRIENQVNLSGTGSELIMEIGSASENFRESSIPKPYFWTYIYSTSPLANFQHIVETNNTHSIDGKRVLAFINNEFLPDAISNRINNLLGISTIDIPLITPILNVATIYGRSYEYISWWGPITMFLYTIIIITAYIYINKNNRRLLVTSVAMLNSIIVLNAFDNMFTKTAFSFQLFYPLVFVALSSKKIRSLSWTKKLLSLWQHIMEKCTFLNK